MSLPVDRTVILAAIDRTAATNQVVHTATSLARLIPNSEIHLVHVIQAGAQSAAALTMALTETLHFARVFLDDIRDRLAEQTHRPVVAHLGVDVPGRHIVELAKDLDASLVVVGTHGKGGVARLLLGSVSQYVANNAPCAVLVARPKEEAAVPEIEPPCADCVALREENADATLWCERHSGKHARGRTHYETPQPFALGSMFVRPEA